MQEWLPTVLLMERSKSKKSLGKRLDYNYAVLTVAGTFWRLDTFLGIASLPTMLTTRLTARAITAIYRELKIPVLNSEVVKAPFAAFAITAMVSPEPIPASSPTMSASFLNQLV